VGFFICARCFASDLLGNILWQKKYRMSPPVSAGTDILWQLARGIQPADLQKFAGKSLPENIRAGLLGK